MTKNKQHKETTQLLKSFSGKSEQYWQNEEKNSRKRIFSRAKKVKAYQSFLKSSNASGNFPPPMSKKDYFNKFSLKELGIIRKNNNFFIITGTSGSTGKPAYFFRGPAVDCNYAELVTNFINYGKAGQTLLIDCFGMGVWIGGVITYQAFYIAGTEGAPVSIITPGINKKEIFNALREIAPSFDCVILAGYPPFIKDILDEAPAEKINPAKLHLRFLFAAESFTENFRDRIKAASKLKSVYFDTANIYGSAELGAMAIETPGSILIRRLALKNPKIYSELFRRDSKQPTLAQYNPKFVSFEEQNGQIYITADSATPLARYAIGDNGGVLKLSEIKKIFAKNKVNLEDHAKKLKIPLLKLPFVYVHERSDFSTTLYGIQVYPQAIKAALEQRKAQKFLTGKFIMQTNYDRKGNQYLELHLECKPKTDKISAQRKKTVIDLLVKGLLRKSSEYRELSKMLSETRTKPKLNFWKYNHPEYFKPGIKQKWIKK